MSLQSELSLWLQNAWSASSLPSYPIHSWESCSRPQLGDLTFTGAFVCAKALKSNPKTIAQQLLDHLPPHPLVKDVSIAGPGYINITLSPCAWEQLPHLEPFDAVPTPAPTLVEFVSANPTGPLHLGHARQAVLGSVLVALLKRLGGVVGSEFFYNDAGVQMQCLKKSLELRSQQLNGVALAFERDGDNDPNKTLFTKDLYHGTYVKELAALAPHNNLLAFAVSAIQDQQIQDLKDLGVEFDAFTSEQFLYNEGWVNKAVQQLLPHTYTASHAKQEPATNKPVATYLNTSAFGDDKDRVMIKSDGSYTYFVPDVAYHLYKWERGWVNAINIQGSDHHGTLKRVQAGVSYANPAIAQPYPKVMFHTMIKVVKNNQAVKASKRAGDYITLKDMLQYLGKDAFRMSMLESKPDTFMTLDIDQWLDNKPNNPMYSIQYAFARIASALNKAHTTTGEHVAAWTSAEQHLFKTLLLWENNLNALAVHHDPTGVSALTKQLAASIHDAYQNGPKWYTLNDECKQQRIGLFTCAQTALQNACGVLGINPYNADVLNPTTHKI